MLQTVGRDTLFGWMREGRGLVLVDLTPAGSFSRTHLPGAISLTEHQLVFEPDEHLPDKSARIVLYGEGPDCPEIFRSAWHLEALGYADVWVFPGGEDDWLQADLPTEGGWAA